MSTLDKFDTDMIIRNKNYETDLKYDLEMNRILLKIIGVWPADSRHLTKFDRIIAVLARLLTIFSLLFLMVPTGCYALFVTTNWSVSIQMLATVLYCFEAIVKFGIVIARNDEIKHCIDMIAADWRDAGWKVYRSIMLENARSCRLFAKLFVSANYFTIITYHLVATFVFIRTSLFQHNGTTSAPVLYGAEFFFFDAQVSPMCEIVYFGQNLGAMAMCGVNCAISTMTVKLAMHACSRYQIVTALMQYGDDAENTDENDFWCQEKKQRKFAQIVRRHLNAIEFVPRIENALNEICFVSFAVSTVNICFIGYTLIVGWEKSAAGDIATYVFAEMSQVSNIFIMCYCGERLAEQCRQVGMAGYMTNWWTMQPRESRALILMIVIAQIPVQFTAGKFFILSLKTFGAVMKIAMSYLNFLRTTIQLHG